ncbi:MAG: sigma-70 family RNA polymerase sigma factor [Solirubrobacterales bacterium]|nr:sigma-70 family RNA polymerase sigma factor [Solirubrobacterales bacterium]MBV9716443.1 sigma-70 family RNA polymerase sigma factor [Solirubrobacterales bacterium]
MEPDEALIERTLTGDMTAFERLVERHQAVVFRTAARMVGPAEAEDVSQDALLRAFHGLPSFRRQASFRTWLLQITHHAAVNALTRSRRRRVDPAAEAEMEEIADPKPQPVESLETSERRGRLQLKLGLLRPEYRALVVLRDLEGLSYDEIAQVLDMPLGSVKGRLHRARGELIALLRANTYDWELPE